MGRAEDLFERLVSEGESAIDEFIETRMSEELFLDFKRSADNGSGRHLNHFDRKKLAKAISGFGNSEGGILIWGVDCSEDETGADVAKSKVMISDVDRFKGWLEGAVSSCTVPPHRLVRHHVIEKADTNDGFVVSLVPKSDDAPHQTVLSDLNNQYFIRAGSSFMPCPHAVLAGMFGRRPQPHVFHSFVVDQADVLKGSVKVDIGFMLHNTGLGIAEDLFLHLAAGSIPGASCSIEWKLLAHPDWTYWSVGGYKISMISKDHLRIPPEGEAFPVITVVHLRPPFTKDLKIRGLCGSRNSPLSPFLIHRTSSTINDLYEEVQRKLQQGVLTEVDRTEFCDTLLKQEVSISG